MNKDNHCMICKYKLVYSGVSGRKKQFPNVVNTEQLSAFLNPSTVCWFVRALNYFSHHISHGF